MIIITNGTIILSRMNFSGYVVGHMIILYLVTECCLVVG